VADTDHLGRPIVVVTGTGIITSLGQGQTENWNALTNGVSGIHRITRFPIGGLRTTIAGTVDFIPVTEPSAPAYAQRLAELVIEEALGESGIGRPGDFPGPLFLALPPVELEWPQRRVLATAAAMNDGLGYTDLVRAAEQGHFEPWYERFLFGSVGEGLASRFGTKGSPIATSTACASGGTAIQLGVEAIRRGECDAALVVGTDASVNPESLIRFSLLSALSTRNDPPSAAARPFSKDRDGFVMAEGAGALVLESLAHARARGAVVLGVVEGCGEAADGFHRTRSSPDGKPIIACMTRALADGGVAPDAVGPSGIGYVNAHGTGTPENDKMEWVGISAVFGERSGSLPIIQQVDDRPHADRGGDHRGDLHAVCDALRIVAADDQLRHSRPGAAA
jgi:3-oxoacyl-[acyl-carrier-protein] synthase II